LPLTIVFLFLYYPGGIANPNTAALTQHPEKCRDSFGADGRHPVGRGIVDICTISLFEKPSVTPLGIAFVASSVLSLLVLKLGSRQIKRQEYLCAI
jgi:hypothetical protein